MKKFLHNNNGYVEQDCWLPGCWVNIEKPDKDDVSFLIDDLHMPSDFLDSISDINERSRIEHDGEWILTILRVPLKTPQGDSPFTTVPIGIVTNNEILVTICYHKTELIDDFINFSRCKGLDISQNADFVLHIMYSATHWYLEYIQELYKSFRHSSRKLEKSIHNNDLLELQRIQTTLVYFSTSIKGNETVIGRLSHIYNNNYDPDLIEDVEIDQHQADITVDIYSQILDSTLDSFASVISNNVNEIMKRMTGISIILMFPTLVASFFGMNVPLPFSTLKYSYLIIAAASVAISLVLYKILRRIHWL